MKNGGNPLWISEYFRKISQKGCKQDACEKMLNRLLDRPISGVPEVIRTPDLPLRRRPLYPAELQEHLPGVCSAICNMHRICMNELRHTVFLAVCQHRIQMLLTGYNTITDRLDNIFHGNDSIDRNAVFFIDGLYRRLISL